jgi:hypothetical protein
MRRRIALLAALAASHPASVSVQTRPPAVKSLGLYVFDCGTLTPNREGVERYHVTMQEVGETRMPVPCFLIVHPRGTLMWDVGVIPDSVVEASTDPPTSPTWRSRTRTSTTPPISTRSPARRG